MKAIIAGTRTWKDIFAIRMLLNEVQEELGPITEIVSGGASGADEIGEMLAKEKDIPVRRFPADWDKHGKAAGPIRNREMAAYADVLLLAWDGESPGSRNMLRTAREYGLGIYGVIR